MQNESLSLKACRLVYTFLKFVAFVDVTWHAEQNARLFLCLLRKWMMHFTGNASQEHVLHHSQMILAAIVQVRNQDPHLLLSYGSHGSHTLMLITVTSGSIVMTHAQKSLPLERL